MTLMKDGLIAQAAEDICTYASERHDVKLEPCDVETLLSYHFAEILERVEQIDYCEDYPQE
jgi:hypothetical protein